MSEFWRCYGAVLCASIYSNFSIYMGALRIQSRHSCNPSRFSTIDYKRLGRWRFFIAFPRKGKKLVDPFQITVDGEKWAIIHFVLDVCLSPLLILLLKCCTSLNGKDVCFICIIVFEIPFAVFSLWIHIISNRILKMPQNFSITDALLQKHLSTNIKNLKNQIPEPDYRCEQIVKIKEYYWETNKKYSVIVRDRNGKKQSEKVLAIERSSRYYQGKDITLLPNI